MNTTAEAFKRERFIWGIRYLERVMFFTALLYPVMRLLGFFSIKTGIIWAAMGAVMIPANLWGRRLYRTSAQFETVALVGVYFNLVMLTLVVYSTGAVESPFLILYAITAVGSSVHMNFRQSVAAVLVGTALLAGVASLELTGRIPHVALFANGSDPGLYLNPGYVAFVLAALLVFLLLTSYGSGFLANRVRERESQLEKQAQQHWIDLGHFSAVVAHEVKNPLATVKGAAGILEKSDLPADTRQRMVKTIRDEMDRLGDLVTQYLEFARPRAPQLRVLSLNDAVRRASEVAGGPAMPESSRINLQLDPSLPELRGDPDQLHQVLLNLIENARQAVGTAGEITITTRRNELLSVLIEVADTGPGIPPDQLAQIFQPFFTTKTRGSGLGLAVSRKIVEAHGGTLTARNLPGGGAAFTLRLEGGS